MLDSTFFLMDYIAMLVRELLRPCGLQCIRKVKLENCTYAIVSQINKCLRCMRALMGVGLSSESRGRLADTLLGNQQNTNTSSERIQGG